MVVTAARATYDSEAKMRWVLWVAGYGNVALVKTTVEISDALLDEAKRVATRESSMLRELIEEGLRRSLDERKSGRASVCGALRIAAEDFSPASRRSGALLREAAYEERTLVSLGDRSRNTDFCIMVTHEDDT